jgi:hypothetical protein
MDMGRSTTTATTAAMTAATTKTGTKGAAKDPLGCFDVCRQNKADNFGLVFFWLRIVDRIRKG